MRIVFFFFNDTATTEIYTLSLHDALPISHAGALRREEPALRDDAVPLPDRGSYAHRAATDEQRGPGGLPGARDRKSTRLNSSHLVISYAVFCLKKKSDLALRQQSGGSCCA